ncbi:MAG: hypothetical protein WCA20_36840 [Candidatus Sulfotelmatobacter sp.]
MAALITMVNPVFGQTATPAQQTAQPPARHTERQAPPTRDPNTAGYVVATGCSKAPTNFAQRLRMSQLTKQHGHELSPAGETPRMALGFMLAHRDFKFQTEKNLQNRRKYAAYSIQG